MKMDLLITGVSQLVTAEGEAAKRGRAMGSLKIIKDAALAVTRRKRPMETFPHVSSRRYGRGSKVPRCSVARTISVAWQR